MGHSKIIDEIIDELFTETETDSLYGKYVDKDGVYEFKNGSFIKVFQKNKVFKMQWKVLYFNINTQEFKWFNIFDHGGFLKDCIEMAAKTCSKTDFEASLKGLLRYYFAHRAQYEIVAIPWVGSYTSKSKKIDFAEQVEANWDIFVDYVWKQTVPFRNSEVADSANNGEWQ